MSMRQSLLRSWRQSNLLTVLLWPLSLLYRGLFGLKKATYRFKILKSYRAPVPVIVVGNITVGGSGKTPLVIYLIELLRKQGFKPGVISRGYGGLADHYPIQVTPDCAASDCGDEPLLIFRRTAVPMVVGPNRQDDIKLLMQDFEVNIIISDDGLQHFALARDVEICVVDETTAQDNHYLLPAGPYREPLARLNSVDMVVRHIQATAQESPVDEDDTHYIMTLHAELPMPLRSDSSSVFDAKGGVHAVAGIGNPQRFFNTCRQQGWDIEEHAFADHHVFVENDFDFADDKLILMTEKDAVKCQEFANDRHWYLPVNARMSNRFEQQLRLLIEKKV